MKTHLPQNTRRRDPKLILGLVALVLANSLHYALPRLGLGPMSDGFDLVQGTLMGIAIGLLIWSVVTSTRSRTTC